MVGSACVALSDCCSGLCAEDINGFRVCQFLGGCRPEEELCRTETDCCAFASTNKGNTPVCQQFGDAGVGRCRALSGDAPAGEVCEGSRGNTCAPNNSYCTESISGILRCAGSCDGGVCGGGNCLPTGAGCASPDQCCSFICAPGADGGFACAAACLQTGDACSSSADCCSGSCSHTGVCEIPVSNTDGGVDAGPTCRPIAATCSTSAECCSGTCDQTTLRCESSIN